MDKMKIAKLIWGKLTTPNPSRKRKHITKARRDFITFRDGGKCQSVGCNKRGTEYGHIIAHKNGGSVSVFNIALSCESCNDKTSTKFWNVKNKRFKLIMNIVYTINEVQ